MNARLKNSLFYAAEAVLLLFILVHVGSRLTVSPDAVTIVYGEPAGQLPEAHASILGLNADRLIWQSDKADPSIVGTAKISYRLHFLGIPMRRTSAVLTVMDMEAPVLELEDGVICFSRVNEPWTYPAYTVSDNYDAPDDIELTVTGEADSTKEGIYDAKLKACDTSGNCVQRSVTMVVGSASDSDFEPENFSLYELDTHGVLLEPDEPNDAAYEELYWMGDSNILNLSMYDGVPSNRVMARYAMAPESFDKPLHYQNTQQSWNAVEGVKLLKPKRLIIQMGEAEAGSGNPLRFAEDYGKCLDQLLEANPGMELYVSAILPVREANSEAAATQEQINRANYCLLRMCEEKKIPMICADAWLKDSSGYGIPDYYLEDGFHLSANHFPAYTDYVRRCLIS